MPRAALVRVHRGKLIELSMARHAGDWQRWHELTAAAPPFLAPEFFALSAPLAVAQPLLAEAWRDGRLAGALPLLRDGHTLRALATPHTPEFDYCGAAEALEDVWRAVRGDRGWRTLILERVPIASPLASRFVDRVRAEGTRWSCAPGRGTAPSRCPASRRGSTSTSARTSPAARASSAASSSSA